MINGESYKVIVAEAAKNALGMDNIYERVFIVKLLTDKNNSNRVCGAVGFSVREHKTYVFKCKAMIIACGGVVNVFRPRSVGEGQGRAWYPVWNAGSTYAMPAEIGAKMVLMENRFVPARFKDGYGPVGAWFLFFKAQATNAYGEDYMARNWDRVKKEYPGYADAPGTCLRNHAAMIEMREGRGPIMMHTDKAMQKLAETPEQERAQASGSRSLGRLSGYVHLRRLPVGLLQHGARQDAVGNHPLRALPARFSRRLRRSVGLRSRQELHGRAGQLVLGL